MPVSMTPTTTFSPVSPLAYARPGTGEAEELAARVGGELPQLIGNHQRDLRGAGELDRFVVADDGGEAVERVRVVLDLVGVVDTGVGEHLVVRLLQHRRLRVGGRGVEVVLRDRCDERVGRHDHDVATGRALGDGLARRIDDRFDRSGILLANTLLGSGCPDRYEQRGAHRGSTDGGNPSLHRRFPLLDSPHLDDRPSGAT